MTHNSVTKVNPSMFTMLCLHFQSKPKYVHNVVFAFLKVNPSMFIFDVHLHFKCKPKYVVCLCSQSKPEYVVCLHPSMHRAHVSKVKLKV